MGIEAPAIQSKPPSLATLLISSVRCDAEELSMMVKVSLASGVKGSHQLPSVTNLQKSISCSQSHASTTQILSLHTWCTCKDRDLS